MPIEIDVAMDYRLGEDRTVLLAIEAARSLAGQTVTAASLDIGGGRVDRIAGEAGVGQRIWATLDGDRMRLRYRAGVEVTRRAAALETLGAAPPAAFTAEAVPFLRPSRYCQSDMFAAFVARHFAGLGGGATVAAIRDWTLAEMAYIPGSSDASTTVLESFISRQGVCRDYAHMVCAMARAARIPARYVSVYAPDVTPPDFHAVAEVWLEGVWHLVDATGMCTPGDTVVVAVGRDAGDVAFMETVGMAQLVDQSVTVSRTPARPAPAR